MSEENRLTGENEQPGENELTGEIRDIFRLFFDEEPVSAKVIETGRGEEDFRNAVILGTAGGNRYVLKITANDFTNGERIRVWKRTIEEYRALGYYCPMIYSDKKGGFPTITYRGRECVAYAEEFSKYKMVEDRPAVDENGKNADCDPYFEDMWAMTAKIAAKKFQYSQFPSAYCLFELFCPSDEIEEVLENAQDWKELAEQLPEEFSGQVARIWKLWSDNREALREPYSKLPTSVFQADMNSTNLLVDEDGRFAGVCDFNLCGRDVFLNYLMRECIGDFEREISDIRRALTIASRYYTFSEEEKAIALPLYRCLKPLWFIRVEDLREAGEDREAVKRCLDRTEHFLTADIDFASYMG
ncbi:MAG: hypothetical protein IKZ69_07610 [Lachnospiraceae bacterium]|nr:hypothetical protein [Lachnospiraceae bacterium]